MSEFYPWQYHARVEDVVDGDTFDLIFDLGFRTYSHQRVRLIGVDTAEIYGVSHDSEQYERGTAHAEFVKEWFIEAETDRLWPLRVETARDTGKYGRWLCNVERTLDNESLSKALVDEFPDLQ